MTMPFIVILRIQQVFSVLAFNDFFNNHIPRGLYNLTNLTHLNLSRAGFLGQIPIELGRMRSLISLDLSENFQQKLENPNLNILIQNLTGFKELVLDGVNISAQGSEWGKVLSSSLPSLTYLSLRNCHLSGPKELASLTFLSVMNLSFNKLSGMIPTGTQLQTFTTASYEENVELCGFPLKVSCNDLGASPPKLETQHLYPEADINWYYAFAALGYVVGLGITVCLLLYCKNWRQRSFEQLDQVFSKIFNHQVGRKRCGGRKAVRRNQVRRQ